MLYVVIPHTYFLSLPHFLPMSLFRHLPQRYDFMRVFSLGDTEHSGQAKIGQFDQSFAVNEQILEKCLQTIHCLHIVHTLSVYKCSRDCKYHSSSNVT